MPTLTGQTLGRYHLLEPLGEGGMAVVYKAYDTRLETDVAVKVIRTENLPPSTLERALKRFEREAKALAKLTHPNIIPVSDYGEYGGQPYLVMKYLPGGTLKQKLNGKPIPWQEAARLLVPVARALDYAHRQGMIHRDVKPSNVLITEDGEPMLSDFGIAKIIDEEATVDLTSTSATVGTPEYMAPEQVISKAVDHRADIYALGVVFYEMVTGRKPFQADTPMAVLFKHASEPLPRPGQYVRDLPEQIESVLLKMLAKRPEERYASMAEVAKMLDDIAIDGRLSVVIEKTEPQSAEVQPAPIPVAAMDDRATVDQELLDNSALIQEDVELPDLATVLQPETREEADAEMKVKNLSVPQPLEVADIFDPETTAHSDVDAVNPAQMESEPPHESDQIDVVMIVDPESVSELEGDQALVSLGEQSSRVVDFIEIVDPEKSQREIVCNENEKTISLGDGVTMTFVRIPTGMFWMGSRTGRVYADEMPIHKVNLDEYWIGKTPVTNLHYQKFVQALGKREPKHWANSNILEEKRNHPVIYVTWQDAVDFCNWASEVVGQNIYLPTEAEWEKAARGTDARKYPWGNERPTKNLVNYGDTGSGNTSSVGQYSPQGDSPYGCADMAGNVWEWVSDWYSGIYYKSPPVNNPTGPSIGKFRTIRGGSWNDLAYYIRCAYRVRNKPDFALNNIGFRCACSKFDSWSSLCPISPDKP